MSGSQKAYNFVKGDRVVYRPSKDSPDTSIGKINKILQESPHDKPRFIVQDEKSNEEKVYGSEHILQTTNRI